MTFNLRRDFVYLIAIAVAALIACLAVVNISTSAAYGPYLSLDSLLERQKGVSAGAVKEYTNRLGTTPLTCRTDVVKAVSSVTGQNVRQEERASSREGWLVALRQMEPFVRAGLACFPTNGELWARLAVVRWLLGGSSQDQATLLITSQAYAPAEWAALELRLAQWRRVTPAVMIHTDGTMRSDISNILNYGEIPLVKNLLSSLTEPMAAAVQSEWPIVSATRIEQLRRSGIVSDGAMPKMPRAGATP